MRTGKTPAFYALGASGVWKDYVNLLHIPYTLWHLSYVVLGAAVASTVHVDRLLGTLLAFFLAMGIGAHSLGRAQRPSPGNQDTQRRARRPGRCFFNWGVGHGCGGRLDGDAVVVPLHGFRRFHRRRLQSGSCGTTGSTPTSGLPLPGGLSRR